jgi:hypothetical protein
VGHPCRPNAIRAPRLSRRRVDRLSGPVCRVAHSARLHPMKWDLRQNDGLTAAFRSGHQPVAASRPRPPLSGAVLLKRGLQESERASALPLPTRSSELPAASGYGHADLDGAHMEVCWRRSPGVKARPPAGIHRSRVRVGRMPRKTTVGEGGVRDGTLDPLLALLHGVSMD